MIGKILMNPKKSLDLKFVLLQSVCSKYGILTTLLIVLQQLLTASSVIFITKAINNLGSPEDVIRNISFFFLFLILPYIPVCIAQVTMFHVVNDTHHNLVNRNLASIRFKTKIKYIDEKDIFLSNLSRNSFMILNDYYTYIYRVISLVLNILFTIVIISSILKIEFLYSFLISLILSFIHLKYITSKIEISSTHVEKNLVSYSNIIERSWDNFTLGSNRSVQGYNKKLNYLAQNYYSSKLKNASLQQISNFISALIALIPLMVVSLYVIHGNISNNQMLSSILVNLTRMVGLFSFLGTLIFDITNFINIKSRIISMLSGLNLTETYENKVLIKGLKPIYVNNKIIDDLNYFFDEILKLNNGRFTITGDNGAGKTTLLLSLLRKERDKVIFIPSDPGTIEWNIDITNKSTGSKIFSILYSEIDNSNEKVILLDEWDANLDTENKSKIDKLIDKISEKKVVIEVRHL